MKYACLLLLLLPSLTVRGNKIDSLKTKAAVDAFFRTYIDTNATGSIFRQRVHSADTLCMIPDSFYVTDLDGNGLSDMIICGSITYIVLAKKAGQFAANYMDGALAGLITVKEDTLPLIVFTGNRWKMNKNSTERIPFVDTLICKYGGVLKFNARPDTFLWTNITFSGHGCFGTCPVFDLEIGQDGTALLNAIAHNEHSGRYTAKIDPVTFTQIQQIVSYVSPRTLSDSYDAEIDDDMVVSLRIRYSSGFEKTITDDGLVGPIGLQRLFGCLWQLRLNQKWTKQ